MIKSGFAKQNFWLKSRALLALGIICLIGLASQAALPQSAYGGAAKTPKIEFEPRISSVANLIYQLDCLAELNDTPLEAWHELWHKRLGWSAADDAQLNRWKQIRQKYLRIISVEPEVKDSFAYLPDDLFFRAGKLNLGDKLKIAGLRAASLDDYGRSLELLITVVEAAELKSILIHFEPRFDAWWKAGAERAMQDFAAQMQTLVKEKSLNEFCARVAVFYGAELPEKLAVPFNLIARPKTNSTDATATVIENQGLVEIIPGEDSENRIGIVCHELFHYFYGQIPQERKIKLLQAFIQSKDDSSLAGLNLLDEALATAIGNGIIGRLTVSKKTYQKDLQEKLGFYHDEFIDATGKKLIPVVERWINQNKKLDQQIVPEYLSVVREALGEKVSSPLLALKFFMQIVEDRELRQQSEPLLNAIGPRINSTAIPIDQEALDFVKKYPEASFIILVRYNGLNQLKSWEDVIGTKALTAINRLQHKDKGFVYAVVRTPRAKIYLFVGQDAKSIGEVTEKFSRSNSPFVGVNYEVPISDN